MVSCQSRNAANQKLSPTVSRRDAHFPKPGLKGPEWRAGDEIISADHRQNGKSGAQLVS
jgi:hypothetical protein